ncbi:type VI secretion system lipoprotein TssJ [Candidatus Curculioniphilus buchneri]|uniref:type VI secretion system lipoprotein TssJ n=1 Tax=Candidatus Curculioniphilus buchneri TaxID=690594 RepID=UPI00376EED41
MLLSLLSRLLGYHHYFLFFWIPILLLSSCTADQQSSQREYILNLNILGQINQGLPLKIRIFFLNNKSIFLSSDYLKLQDISDQMLFDTVIHSQDFFLLPGEKTKKLHLNLPFSTKYIGLFAEYKDITHQHWRTICPTYSNKLPLWRRLLNGSTDSIIHTNITVTSNGLKCK